MKTVLHLVNKSPPNGGGLAACLRFATTGGSLLLTEDGVYAARPGAPGANDLAERMKDLAVYALGPDLEARGMTDTPLVEGVSVVDYGEFVDLVVAHDLVHSWP